METLIVFSHLRWDFVYQRPQHLMSRLARHYRIVFIEEPQAGRGAGAALADQPAAAAADRDAAAALVRTRFRPLA